MAKVNNTAVAAKANNNNLDSEISAAFAALGDSLIARLAKAAPADKARLLEAAGDAYQFAGVYAPAQESK